MAKTEKTMIRIRRGINGVKYCACDKNGNPIRGFDKLSDIRRYWMKEIKWGYVELVRELDKMPDMEAVYEMRQVLEELLRAYTNKSQTLAEVKSHGCSSTF